MPRYSAEKKDAVRRAYVVDRLDLKTVARLHEVPYATVRDWRNKARGRHNDWERSRRANQLSEGGMDYFARIVMDEFVPLLESSIKAVTEDKSISAEKRAELVSRLADSLTKTTRSVGATNPALQRLAFANDLIRQQVDFARERFPQHVPALLEMMEAFGEHLGLVYG